MTLFRSIALLAVLLVPALAHAQDQRLRVSVGAAATAGAIDSEPALTASVGYRFADRLSFDVEVTAVDAPANRFSDVRILREGAGPAGVVRLGAMMPDNRRGVSVQGPSIGAFARVPSFDAAFPIGDFRVRHDGSTALATFGFRYELASQVSRFLPYVSGGIGISRTEERFRVSAPTPLPARPGISPTIRPIMDIDETVSHTGLATSAGVGASIRLVAQLSADLDARYFRLHPGRNLARFGGGVSYRF